VIFEVAHGVGLVPLAWLVWLRLRGSRREASWWWMGVALAVSFVADFLPHPVTHQAYPVTQGAIFALVLLPRERAVWVIALLLSAAATSIALREAGGLDLLLRVVAWGSVAALGSRLPPGPLRTTLTWGFGAMVFAWLGYVYAPGWYSWGLLQAARLGTALGFCRAAWKA
jgi:hypothetical protein